MKTASSAATATAKSVTFTGPPKQICAELKSKHGVDMHQSELSVLTRFGNAEKLGEIPKTEKRRGRAGNNYRITFSLEQIKAIKANQDQKQANKVAKAAKKSKKSEVTEPAPVAVAA